MKSMTGYGKGVAEDNGRRVTIEIRSVNHRYLDLLFKIPRGYNYIEDCLREEIKKSVSRGHLGVYCHYEDTREGQKDIKIDKTLAQNYLKIGKELEKLGVKNDFTASQLLKMPEVLIMQGADEDEEAIKGLVITATREALRTLLYMRQIEGEALAEDLKNKFLAISGILRDVEEKSPEISKIYRVNLKEKIQEILCEVEYDEARLLNEVAYYAERVSIDEELTRLKSHVAQGQKMLNQDQPLGRKFNFLVQEMLREANTIGAKCNDMSITKKVLTLKCEIENIREQVQNIE